MYNPYNWKIKPRKNLAEEKYEKNFNKIQKKYEELKLLNDNIDKIKNEIISLEEENFNIMMSDDISYDFLLSRIK